MPTNTRPIRRTASVRGGKHESEMVRFLRHHRIAASFKISRFGCGMGRRLYSKFQFSASKFALTRSAATQAVHERQQFIEPWVFKCCQRRVLVQRRKAVSSNLALRIRPDRNRFAIRNNLFLEGRGCISSRNAARHGSLFCRINEAQTM
jgi:hypothetical protein